MGGQGWGVALVMVRFDFALHSCPLGIGIPYIRRRGQNFMTLSHQV